MASADSRPPERDPVAPGAPYYVDHFRQVLDAVKQRYGFLLAQAEHDHIRRIEALSLPAQMLYARLVNRRGPCFRRDRLVYQEIPALDEAVAELSTQALLLPCDAAGAPDLRHGPYRCFTVEELRASLAALRPPRFARRDDLLTWLGSWEGCAEWRAGLLTRHPVLRLPANDPWPFLRFLLWDGPPHTTQHRLKGQPEERRAIYGYRGSGDRSGKEQLQRSRPGR